MSGVRHLTVTADEAGQRLDRWLRRHFPHLTQGRIERMCRKGELRVEGTRAKASTRLEAGQDVRIPPVPELEPRPPAQPVEVPPGESDRRMMRQSILWEDEHLIAINKPPGLATQGGTGQRVHVDMLARALVPENAEPPRLVHRLDRDTSGVLLLARSRKSAEALTQAFRNRRTRKIYWAAVAGVPEPRMGTIRFGLVKAGGRGEGERMRCLHPDEVAGNPDARHAVTDYAVLSALGRRAAWVALVPVTGRTHQLRAHMAHLGHPIIGDGKYGTRSQENPGDGWGASLGQGLSRKLHLHARALIFRHPLTGRQLEIIAPLPPHMARSWDFFQWDPADVPLDPFREVDA